MEVRFVGQYEVAVPEYHPEKMVKPGEVIEVSDELGARLLEQPVNWSAATRQTSPSSKKESVVETEEVSE